MVMLLVSHKIRLLVTLCKFMRERSKHNVVESRINARIAIHCIFGKESPHVLIP